MMGWPNNYVQGVYDSTGKVIGIDDGDGGIIYSTQFSAWGSLPAAADNLYRQYIVTDLNNSEFYSNGERWKPKNGTCILRKITEPVKIVFPAATFTSISYANNGGGKARITSVGAHGLTTGAALAGVNIYIEWGGGYGINGLAKILTVPNATSIDFDVTYDIGNGTPTIKVAGAANFVDVVNTTIPAKLMGINGEIMQEGSLLASGTVGNRNIKTLFEATQVHYFDMNTTLIKSRFNSGVVSLGSVSSQGALEPEYGRGYSQSVLAYVTTSYNTEVDTSLTLQVSNSVDNEVISLQSYSIIFRG